MTQEAEKQQQLVMMAWAGLFGMFIVVLFGVLFVIILQLHRIELNATINDAYHSTVQALNSEQ